MILQGREVSDADIELIRSLMATHPTWRRTPLSVELCRRWNWCNAQGRLKDMAARTLLLKLERAGHIQLPPRQRPSPNASRNRRIPAAPAPSEPIHAALRNLQPLRVNIVAPGSDDAHMFDGLLAHEHYLGHRTIPSARTSATSCGIGRDERWHASCLARRRGSVRTATHLSAGIARHANITCSI